MLTEAEPNEAHRALVELERRGLLRAVITQNIDLKPDVVFFGELLPEAAIDRAFELAREAALMLVVGSSLEVYPVAGLPLETLEAGGRLAIVSRGPTPLDRRATLTLDGSAGELLSDVVAALD
jgi:NAD-dependent deacetylase